MTDSSKQDASELEPTVATETGNPPLSTTDPTGLSAQSTERRLLKKIMYLLEHRAAEAIIGILGIIVAIIIAIVTLNPPSPPIATPASTTAPTPATPVVVALRNLDIRSGPGSQFNRIGVLAAEDSLDIRGITDDSTWYQVLLANGTYGWVLAAESFGRFVGNRSVLAIVTPTATPTATPSLTPSPSHTPTNTPTNTPSPTNTATETATSTATLTDTPRPSVTPTQTSEPSATIPSATPVLTHTDAPTTIVRAYPCEASIVPRSPSSLTLRIIYRVPSTSVAPSGSIRQGTPIVLLEKLAETPTTRIFFNVADSSGSPLGWILGEYIVLSAACPS